MVCRSEWVEACLMPASSIYFSTIYLIEYGRIGALRWLTNNLSWATGGRTFSYLTGAQHAFALPLFALLPSILVHLACLYAPAGLR